MGRNKEASVSFGSGGKKKLLIEIGERLVFHRKPETETCPPER